MCSTYSMRNILSLSRHWIISCASHPLGKLPSHAYRSLGRGQWRADYSSKSSCSILVQYLLGSCWNDVKFTAFQTQCQRVGIATNECMANDLNLQTLWVQWNIVVNDRMMFVSLQVFEAEITRYFSKFSNLKSLFYNFRIFCLVLFWSQEDLLKIALLQFHTLELDYSC